MSREGQPAFSAPVNVEDVERIAAARLPRAALDYYRSGAGEEYTLRNNREAFRRLRIRPRVLRDVSIRDLSTVALGKRVAVPFGIAPTAMHCMAHPDGEVASARAAEKIGAVFILSTLSTRSLEEVAEAAPKATKWFQLYIYKNRNITEDLVRRAERLGYKALVLTVDAPLFGIRWADARNKFHLPPHLKLANFTGPAEADGVRERTTKGSQLQAYVTDLFDQTLTWDALTWLKSITKLPIILKGILTKEDVEEAINHNVAGVMVSNHGARQVDGFPATIEALPEIVKAVCGRCEVFMDGGVTQGTDVFKALALGAKMVFIGRPVLWGLAYDGEEGAKTVLEIIRHEFDFTLALTGCSSIAGIEKEMVVPASFYSLL
ncbi:hydroxyacid oxidase 1 [Ischnura elegans]|uniref:hydroxyacid oxidase 1 n=1 Tax=Ischnura elegans TaxID=197161 RepID=UPI001ED86AE4|nr:hydroxyacid oxidase 1 [Ischnura elegans]